ncbi:heavy metal-associated isoprenylated plant protein 16 isoform X1 [Raphanus sativus]|uniref:Heavy metal-associated isoprenylated plant protein 16 isoform X1 n=1 Tax=Raphanus sativus TaxID=3726 RepID=A0A6J0N4P1_RAPSA|nr:heavy metal-associated isoprenylated plant protein 16 isoform X1 [Raphanus sativus]
MKQKILFRVTMTDDKTRAKAMTKAVQFKGKKTFSHSKVDVRSNAMGLYIGVSAVEIKGDHRNQIEVTGTEVDMIGLTKRLRKKVAFAELVSVSKVEPPKKPDEKKDGDKKDGDKKDGDKKDGDKKDGDKKDGDKKDGDKKKEEEKKPVPCCKPCPPPCKPCPPPSNPCPPPPPCYPSPQGYGVPSAFPYPCNPNSYIGEPVYNQEPGCTIL